MRVVGDGDGERVAGEEADLVARMAGGDHGVPVAELYRRYAGRLYGFGRAKLGDAGLAEELVQECFVRLWRTAGRFDPDRASVRTYLFTIAGSVSIDLYRRRAAHPFEPLPERDLPTRRGRHEPAGGFLDRARRPGLPQPLPTGRC